MILSLPTELKIKVCTYLTPKDLLTLSRSCKTLRPLVLDTIRCKKCYQYKKNVAICHLTICNHHFICQECLFKLLHYHAAHLNFPQFYDISVSVKNNIYQYAVKNPFISEQLIAFYNDDNDDDEEDYDKNFYADSDDEPFVYFLSKLLAL